jgi:DNA-binding NtrC family response regulator
MPTPLPEKRLRVLHLEDSELDHQLMLAHLRRGGLLVDVVRIDSEAEFLQAIEPEQDWDVVISDYNLPGFSGLVALDLLKASAQMIPFILVSGEIGEDTAVEAMRNGASDYLLKNNLTRLAPALLHAVETHELVLARQRADRELGESNVCTNWHSICRPAWRPSVPPLPARSTTTWAAR